MPESSQEAEKRVLRELEGKNIAHYSILLSAWIETKMERDKTLVTLSAAAIGLLVTILTTVGAKHFWEIPLFAFAVISFLVTIWSSLTIYQLNSEHLEEAIKGSSVKDPRLEKYDKQSVRAFIIGSVVTLLIGVSSASYELINPKVNKMTSQQKSSDSSQKPATLRESLDGVTKLNPSLGKKSFDGITNLNPQAVQQTTQSAITTQNSSTSSSDTTKK